MTRTALEVAEAAIEPADLEFGWRPDGSPTTASLAQAIFVWARQQGRTPITIGDAAITFRVSSLRVSQAVDAHYGMHAQERLGGRGAWLIKTACP